jgi:nucleotide-binding universal stress UspA family protein
MPAENAVSRIVVGVDGSASSRAALRWAVRQAKLAGGTVEAVIAWQVPTVITSTGWTPVYAIEEGDFAQDARKHIDAVIADVVEPADSKLVHTQVIKGHPAPVLLDAAAGADLLVIGSRGHSGFADALLGSVGLHCVHHAHCPVLIMRGESAS